MISKLILITSRISLFFGKDCIIEFDSCKSFCRDTHTPPHPNCGVVPIKGHPVCVAMQKCPKSGSRGCPVNGSCGCRVSSEW